MKTPIFTAAFLVFLCASFTFAQIPEPYPETPPTPAKEAAAKMRLLHGFRVELIAAEPLVTDPVDICYDEHGQAYVAEMNDYPYTDKASHKPSQENPADASLGKIRLLVDVNDDGIFDTSTVFADGLSWPTGVVCWKGGIYVTATPDLWYFKDHDGDGVADERRKVYTGFRKYNVQAVMNNPIWGLDNRIYISGSTNGGSISKVGDPDFEPLKASRHDFRFDPRTETLELESGYGRYGNAFDNYGNRFVCNIRNPALHVVMPKRFVDRNPYLPPMDPRQDICDFGDFIPVHRIAPPEAWRVERAKRWAEEEPDRHPETELVGGGAVTSSAGITVYRGDAYPSEYLGNIFVSDASSSLFYRLTVKPDGMTFKADRPDADADFCASPDSWTRFVNFENSPDGCLTVLDMYREAIEHPWSIPDDIHDRIDLERGRDKGRIYRLLPPDENFLRRPTDRLGEMSVTELIPFLDHPNAWHRETAQRLIVERGAIDAEIAELIRVAHAAETTLGQIHAMWTLDGLPGGIQGELSLLMNDPSADVRTQALKLAADYAFEPGIARDIAWLFQPYGGLSFETPSERFWALLGLRLSDTRDEMVLQSVENIPTVIPEDDRWTQAALLYGPVESAMDFLLLSQAGQGASAHSLARNLGLTVGASVKPESINPTLFGMIADHSHAPAAGIAAAAGLADGLKRQRQNLFSLVEERKLHPHFETKTLELAEQIARDPKKSLLLRSYALDLFRSVSFDKAIPIYEALLSPEAPLELQTTILKSLGSYDKPQVPELLIKRWPALSPSLKQQALEILLTRPSYLASLLDAVETKVISPHLITRARRDFLINHETPDIASRAGEIFEQKGDRTAAIERYRKEIAKLKANPEAGHLVFQQFCFACHKAGDEGVSEVGPNLATVKAWDREQLLTNILDPNREVTPDFIEYLITKKDGTTLSGAILNETDAAVLLRRPDGSRLAVFRRDIKEIKNSGLSLMPEGLDAVISPQQMANLIGWLVQ